MSKWIDLNADNRRAILQSVGKQGELQQVSAIEKDWWVTAVLKALFKTSCKHALSFKGGTSLSKGWGLIERLSEDIDAALHHSFFGMERTNKYQRDLLCRKARAYIAGHLRHELDEQLRAMGITGYSIEAVTERMTKDGAIHINSNTDPTVLILHYKYGLKYVDYDQLAPHRIEFLPPGGELEHWREDYAEMQHHFIFGETMGFDELMIRMLELQSRFRNAWK